MDDENIDLSAETLNAFIDGQLAASERSQMLTALQGNPKLRARVCELRALQDQVRNAYSEPPSPVRRQESGRPRSSLSGRIGWPQALAAGVLVMLGAGAGWVSGVSYMTPRLIHGPHGDLTFQAARIDGSRVNDGNVIINVSSADQAHLANALDTAQSVLEDKNGGKHTVMILANDGGVDLLRTDKSPYIKRIAQMLKKYPNFRLVACSNTVEKLQRNSIPVSLIPGARVGNTAIDEIIYHLSKGWLYIKV